MNHKDFKPTSWSIANKTTIYIVTFIVTIAGLMIYGRLPKEQFPDIVIPQFVVSDIYPGTSPEDVENLITKPIEKQLKSVSGIKKIKSQSIADFSMITVEFNTGIPVAVAKQKVQDAVDKSKQDLPTDLENDPVVQEVDFSEFPIMNINISGNFSLDKLKKYAELFQDEIEAMPEITRVDIIGALDREIQINVDIYRMTAAGFTFRDIESAVSSENINISGGELNVNNIRRTLRVTGEFKDMESIRNIVVRSGKGSSVLLRDIADVEDSYAERQNFARLNGKSVITLNVIKRGGANLIAASDKIQEITDKMLSEKLPKGVNVTLTGDQSEKTRVQLNDLINSVILGFIFVVLVLMFFMGTTNAIFVGLAVPLSVLMALLFMPSLHYSLNVIVMFSFLLGLGIVVDDAIVVIENTHRILHDHKDLSVAQAAKMAAGEVFLPVLSGTLTNVAPFFPLLFWPGIVGEFMKYLPVTLILTLFASLVVAFIMNPVFAVSFMKREDHSEPKGVKTLVKPLLILLAITGVTYAAFGFGAGNFMSTLTVLYLVNHFLFTPMIAGFQNTLLPAFMRGYKRFITFLIQGYRPYGALGVVLLMFVAVLFIFVASKPKVEFFPSGEPNFVYVYNQMPIGTDAHVTDSITRILEKRVNEVLAPNMKYVKSVISNVGIGAGDPQNPDRVVAPHKSKVTVAFVGFEDRLGVSTSSILTDIRAKLQGIPGTEISVEKERGGPPTGKPIAIEIAGEDFKVLKQLEKKVKAQIQKAGIKGIEELKSDLVLNKPEILIEIDRIKTTQQGISTAQVALEIRNALYGKEISQFRDAKEEYPIMLRLKTDNRDQIEKLLSLNISYRDMTMGGAFRQVPITTLAKISYESTYSSINRKNQERMVTLSSNVLDGYNGNAVVEEIKNAISGMEDVPNGYVLKMGGEQEDQKETGDFLGIAFAMSLGLIFLILVTQFNSVSKPFIIFFTVALSLIGVLLGFALTHMTFSIVMSGVGIIALAGIVVKNGIILIEFIDELRNRGFGLSKAITEAAAIRLTPVVLTASAAVLGLIPLAVGLNINFGTLFTHGEPEFFLGGDSVTFWGPLAWTIIFGLTFSTFLTLIIVPALYYAVERIKLRIAGKLHTIEDDTSVKQNNLAVAEVL